MKILITGANGLLATNTIKLLLEQGHEVKGFLRSKKKLVLPPHPNLELTEGDIRDENAVDKAVQGCDFVVHAAATTAQDLPDYQSYREINVLGTLNVTKAALGHKPKRIIYVSTANTIGYGTIDNPGKEGDESRKPFTNAYYARSKMEAEKKILAIADKIDVVVVNPTFMLGAYDGKPSSGKIILMAHKNPVFHPPGGKNFVNVKDVAKGITSALFNGKNRETYLMAGENLSYADFFKKIKQKYNPGMKLYKVPEASLKAVGYLGDIPRKMGMKTEISSTNMKILCVGNYYSGKKAEEELGIKFAPIEEGIEEAVAWFKEQGQL